MTTENTDDCIVVDYKEDTLNSAMPLIKIVCISFIIFSVLIDITSIKWHKMTNLIIYEQLIY